MLGTHARYIRNTTVLGRIGERVAKTAHVCTVAKRENPQFARLLAQRMGMLEFDLVSEMLEDFPVKRQAIGLRGLHESSRTKYPVVVKIFNCCAPGITAGVGGKVIGAVGNQCPVQKLGSCVVGK